MPWYKDGAVYVTLGSNAVTGTNTAFIANARVGDAFCGPDGGWYEITNIASDTAISISPNYRGASSGGYFVIAPMQGYPKTLADEFRNINTQWGMKLAALGTTGNYEILPVSKGGTGAADQAGARNGLGLGSAAVESIVPVAKGGTGGTTQAAARAGLGLGSAATAALLGIVSQSGGTPTGSVMESGTNTSGTYVRFADGTQICFKRVSIGGVAMGNPAGSVFYSSGLTVGPFAATFVSAPAAEVTVQSSSGLCWNTSSLDTTNLQFGTTYIISPTSTSATFTLNCIAIGRWF